MINYSIIKVLSWLTGISLILTLWEGMTLHVGPALCGVCATTVLGGVTGYIADLINRQED